MRRHVAIASLPIIAITTSDGQQQECALEADADDAVALSSGLSVLLGRIRAMLRLAAYRRDIEGKARELGETTRALYSLNCQQVDELERASQLRRFLSPQLAELPNLSTFLLNAACSPSGPQQRRRASQTSAILTS